MHHHHGGMGEQRPCCRPAAFPPACPPPTPGHGPQSALTVALLRFVYFADILPLYCRYIAVILPLYCRCCCRTCAMPVSRRRLDEWRRVSGRPGRLQRRAAGQRRQALCLTGPAPWAAAPTVPRPRPRNPSNTQTLTEALTEITLRVYSLHHLRLCVPRCCLARARRRCAGSAWSPTDVVCVCVVGGLRRAGRRCRCPAQS
jgi:hypothetical protein